MKNFKKYCESLTPKKGVNTKPSAKIKGPYILSNGVSIPFTSNMLFLSIDELKSKYNIEEFNLFDINTSTIGNILNNNFNKLKMEMTINENIISSLFKMNNKYLSILFIMRKDNIIINIMGHNYYTPNSLSEIRVVILPFMKYLLRDCKPQLEKFFNWMGNDIDMMIESEIMESIKDYDIQKELYDMGYISLLKKVGFNSKLLDELDFLKKQEDWG